MTTRMTKYFEQLRLSPYLCSAKVPTIGYGTTYYPDGRKVTLDDEPITEDYAEALLNDYCIKNIYPLFTKIPYQLTEWQRASLTSLIYNIGPSAFLESKLYKAICEKDIAGIFKNWDWIKADGKVLKGLVKRRAEELHYFIKDL